MDEIKIDKNTCICGCKNFVNINMFVKYDRVDITNSGYSRRTYDIKACEKCGTVKILQR